MKTFRVTVEAVFDVEAESEEDTWDKLPNAFSLDDAYILDTVEIEGEE